jgi:hypothetical protein
MDSNRAPFDLLALVRFALGSHQLASIIDGPTSAGSGPGEKQTCQPEWRPVRPGLRGTQCGTQAGTS